MAKRLIHLKSPKWRQRICDYKVTDEKYLADFIIDGTCIKCIKIIRNEFLKNSRFYRLDVLVVCNEKIKFLKKQRKYKKDFKEMIK